jgi:hypothetical protein
MWEAIVPWRPPDPRSTPTPGRRNSWAKIDWIDADFIMPNDREPQHRGRRDHLGSVGGGGPTAVGESVPPGPHRLDPGVESPEPHATTSGVRPFVLGCLAWYLVLFVLLVLLECFAARRPPEEFGPPGRNVPPLGAPAEGPTRHQ